MAPNPYPNHQIWLHSPGLGDGPVHYNAISGALQNAQIQCMWNDDPPEKSTILLLLNERTPDEAIEEYLQTIISTKRHVLALYQGQGQAPFFRAWKWLDMGMEDVICLDKYELLGEILSKRFQRKELIGKILNSPSIKGKLIGNSTTWRKTLESAVEMALFSKSPLLITGESGTGKELIARLVHELDKRPDKQSLVLLDCTTIVPELSGSEFFGHEKGAFTSAISNRDGAFALADRGTLFLDEIGELPMRLQAELLRVIQEGVYKRVGSNIWNKTQFRLVCATHRNLLQGVDQGTFRQDLYYRLATCLIHLPPLRERKSDIPELADFFLAEVLRTDNPPPFDPQVLYYLMSLDYPGNIRQLKQLIHRIAYRYTGGGIITLGDIPEADRERSYIHRNSWQENGFRDALRQALANGIGLKDIKRIAGDVALEIAVADAEGNLQEAARRLDVSDRLVQGYLAERRG
jgi:transcriptional regulator with GAF, ATPase, and Fis domain